VLSTPSFTRTAFDLSFDINEICDISALQNAQFRKVEARKLSALISWNDGTFVFVSLIVSKRYQTETAQMPSLCVEDIS
jgi:hypothetical protein